MTQDALATSSGISRATIVQIESGIGDIKLSTLAELAAALGTSPIVILMGEEEFSALDEMVRASGRVRKIQTALDRGPSQGADEQQVAEKRAGKIGAQVAEAAGLSRGAAVGAAIGTMILPGMMGTALGAVLGSILASRLLDRRAKGQ